MATALTRWRPTTWGLLESFRREMDDLMSRFFGEEGNGEALTTWAPRVDVEETEKEILVKADLPGVDPKNVEIAIENGVLTIRGKKEERERKGTQHLSEMCYGEVVRSFTLPVAAAPWRRPR